MKSLLPLLFITLPAVAADQCDATFENNTSNKHSLKRGDYFTVVSNKVPGRVCTDELFRDELHDLYLSGVGSIKGIQRVIISHDPMIVDNQIIEPADDEHESANVQFKLNGKYITTEAERIKIDEYLKNQYQCLTASHIAAFGESSEKINVPAK